MAEPARAIVEILKASGFQAYYAGGAVRDQLLGVRAKDFDVVTDARPARVMELFPHHTAVGARFGVILVHRDGESIEVATFRTESSYRDGRHPGEVAYADRPEEDVARRDFTINGLLMDPLTGEILDFVGGRADLQARRVRAIGDPERRFGEDHLRMLRAVRFAARLGFEIEPETLAATQRSAASIHAISAERVRDELTKMLTEGQARRAFELLERTGLLAEVLPEVARMRGVEQPPQYHPEGDVWTHTLMMLADLPAGAPPALAWGVLLHDVGKPPTFRRAPDRIRFDRHAAVGAAIAAAIAQRLRFSGQETDAIVALVAEHMKWPELPNMRASTRLRFLRRGDIRHMLELLRLDCANSHGDMRLFAYAGAALDALAPEQLRPPRLLSGDDLLAMGYAPGPQFREILSAVEDAQLEGELADADAARGFVSRRFPMPH
jgi:poly(A) polymerase